MMISFIEFILEQDEDPTIELDNTSGKPLPKNVRKTKTRASIMAARARKQAATNPLEIKLASSDEKRARLINKIGDQEEKEYKQQQMQR